MEVGFCKPSPKSTLVCVWVVGPVPVCGCGLLFSYTTVGRASGSVTLSYRRRRDKILLRVFDKARLKLISTATETS